MAEDLLRVQITGDASGAAGAISEVSSQAKGLSTDLKAVSAAGEEAGAAVSAGMEKANYSMMEARHSAMLVSEEIGVKLPQALSTAIARSETLGPLLAQAFTGLAAIAFIGIIEQVGEKLSSFIDDNLVFTQTMKDADAATVTMNGEMVKLEDQLDTTDKALKRVGLSADEIARLNFSDKLSQNMKDIEDATSKANEKLSQQPGWWDRIKDASKDILAGQLIGTTEMLDGAQKLLELKNNETQKDKEAADAHKELVEQNALLDATEVENYKSIQTAAVKAVEQANFDFFEKQQHAKAEAAKNDEEFQKQFVGGWLTSFNQISKDQPKIDLTKMIAGGVSSFTTDLEAGAKAAHDYGITLKSDLIEQLANMQKAYDAIVKSGIPVGSQLEDLKKKIGDLKNQIKDFGNPQPLMTLQDATNSLDSRLDAVLNTSTLMKKGWAEFGKQAVLSLEDVGASLVKHLAISLLTDNMEKLSHAKVAAAGAYAAMSPIPFVGPILGAAAAASVFAGAMAFEQGGITPANGDQAGMVSVLHPNEMILPSPVSDVVQDMAAKAGGSSGGGDTHIHAMDAQSFESFLKRNPSALASGMDHAYSRGATSIRKQGRGK